MRISSISGSEINCKKLNVFKNEKEKETFTEKTFPNSTQVFRNNAMANIHFGNSLDKTTELRKIVKGFPNVGEDCTPEKYTKEYDGCLEKVKTYLKENDSKDINLEKVLSDVAFSGHYKIAEYLLDNYKIDVNYQDKDSFNMTPLLSASVQGNSKTIETLAKHGADATVKDTWLGYSPLMHAVLNNNLKAIECISKITTKNIDDVSSQGMTALMMAVQMDYYDVVDKLVKLGADVNKVVDGKTALLHATLNKKMMNKLIALGADKTVKDSFGSTAEELYGAYQGAITLKLMTGEKVTPGVLKRFKENVSLEIKEERHNRRHPKQPRHIRKPGFRPQNTL